MHFALLIECLGHHVYGRLTLMVVERQMLFATEVYLRGNKEDSKVDRQSEKSLAARAST